MHGRRAGRRAPRRARARRNVEEARPRELCDPHRQSRVVEAAVAVIAVPQRQPLVVVVFRDRAYGQSGVVGVHVGGPVEEKRGAADPAGASQVSTIEGRGPMGRPMATAFHGATIRHILTTSTVRQNLRRSRRLRLEPSGLAFAHPEPRAFVRATLPPSRPNDATPFTLLDFFAHRRQPLRRARFIPP